MYAHAPLHYHCSPCCDQARHQSSTVSSFVACDGTLTWHKLQDRLCLCRIECVCCVACRHCTKTKTMMMKNPAVLHALLSHLACNIADYVCYQIEAGAQVVQLFDSWAHHLNPSQFATFSLPYAEEVIQRVRKRHPDTPIIFHANGGKLHYMCSRHANHSKFQGHSKPHTSSDRQCMIDL